MNRFYFFCLNFVEAASNLAPNRFRQKEEELCFFTGDMPRLNTNKYKTTYVNNCNSEEATVSRYTVHSADHWACDRGYLSSNALLGLRGSRKFCCCCCCCVISSFL